MKNKTLEKALKYIESLLTDTEEVYISVSKIGKHIDVSLMTPNEEDESHDNEEEILVETGD